MIPAAQFIETPNVLPSEDAFHNFQRISKSDLEAPKSDSLIWMGVCLPNPIFWEGLPYQNIEIIH
jgi:hypothetical protein